MYNNTEYTIRPVSISDIEKIRIFTDKWIGTNYYSTSELEELLKLSEKNNSVASLAAFYGDEMAAVRLTYSPGNLEENVRGLTPNKWKVDSQKVAYFKSLFVSEKHQAQGLGKILSNKSIEIIKEQGAEAVLCHSWLESPNNSSFRYLKKMGFDEVENHSLYWNPIDYECTRCAPNRCQCTACEMIKYLD